MARALVSHRVPVQIQLVILLSRIPLARGRKLRDNLAVPPLLVCLFGHVPRDRFLVGIVVVDCRAVLGSCVGALGVERRGVVHAVEEFDELAVGDLLWVKDDLSSFSI